MAKAKKTLGVTGSAAVLFLGVSRPLRLEAEVPTRFQERFEETYEKEKGVRPLPGIKRHYQTQENRFGRELRIYFNASPYVANELRALGFHVEEGRPYNKQYQYRINSTALFDKLIKLGFHLGDNV